MATKPKSIGVIKARTFAPQQSKAGNGLTSRNQPYRLPTSIPAIVNTKTFQPFNRK